MLKLSINILYKNKLFMEKKYFSEIVLLTKTYNLQDFKDWLKWHLDIIHFDHIIVFDNESQVDIKSVCELDNRVEYRFVTGWPDQYRIYNNYINNESESLWVLPIDDDEFLYVGEKFNNDVNTMLVELQKRWPDMNKLSVGWLNLFPEEFIETRTKSLIENGNVYSHEACMLFQIGNLPIKTFVKTTQKYEWSDKRISDVGYHKTHNPFTVGNEFEESYSIRGERILCSKQTSPTLPTDDVFLAHYQYKSNSEWLFKCRYRKSPGSRTFRKNKPLVFTRLYGFKNTFKKCSLLIDLFNK